jgi:hypothetical protein
MTGYAVTGTEIAAFLWLNQGQSLGLLAKLAMLIVVIATFIGWFYVMHLYGLYNDTSIGETVID